MTGEPHDVLSTREVRAQLPALLERFREAGADAEPVVIGARWRPEAVVPAVDVGGMDAGELGIRPDAEGLSAGGSWGLATRFGRLDVMQDVPGLRSWRQLRANAVAVNDVLYAGYDELISMKVATRRPEDLRDVGALEGGRRDD